MRGIERRLRQLEEKAVLQVIPEITFEIAFGDTSLTLYPDGREEWGALNDEVD